MAMHEKEIYIVFSSSMTLQEAITKLDINGLM